VTSFADSIAVPVDPAQKEKRGVAVAVDSEGEPQSQSLRTGKELKGLHFRIQISRWTAPAVVCASPRVLSMVPIDQVVAHEQRHIVL
jgi:hypothetical protein